jgi:glutamate racemase
VAIIASGAPLARQVEHVLGARGLAHPRAGLPPTADPAEGDYAFLCTGDVDAFRALGTRFLQMPLGAVDHVAVGRTPEVTPA